MGGEAAAGGERLPWLAEDGAEEAQQPRRSAALWLVPLVLLVGLGALWMLRSGAENGANLPMPAGSSSVTVRLPEPVAVAPGVVEAPLAVKPATLAPEVPKVAKIEEKSAKTIVKASPPVVKTVVPKPKKVVAPPAPSGRVIQIGAFGSSEQARDARLAVLKTYPAIEHLTNKVATTRNSKGREYYRFQLDTTSQAHSELLCQRMQKIGLSCTVVGLPKKAND